MKRPELKDFVRATVEEINLVFLANPGLYKMLQAQDAFIDQGEHYLEQLHEHNVQLTTRLKTLYKKIDELETSKK